jgi:hypothetical protein
MQVLDDVQLGQAAMGDLAVNELAAARSPAGGGCATGSVPASGSGCTTCCWTSSAAKASSTGPAPAWTA